MDSNFRSKNRTNNVRGNSRGNRDYGHNKGAHSNKNPESRKGSGTNISSGNSQNFGYKQNSYDNHSPKSHQNISNNNKSGNWNVMAGWYDSMVGSEGHLFHQNYAIPAVMKFLDLRPGDTVLDIGCGQGALSPYVNKAQGLYYGVDSSDNMIKSAIQRHSKEGRFFIGSADNLENLNEIKRFIHSISFEDQYVQGSEGTKNKKPGFDNVVFLLSLQDMDPLDKIIASAVGVLKFGGKIVILMLHPAFRIPRQSGWGEDKQRKLNYRRMDRYMSESTIPLDTKIKVEGKNVTSYFYHRPLEKYFHELSKNGILIDKLVEIVEAKKGYEEFPTFMCIRGIKQNL